MKFAKQATYIGYVIGKQICPNQHTGFLRFLFTEDSWKIQKGQKLVCRKYFPYNFKIQIRLL